MICTYCRRELDDRSDIYHAIAGWETIDGTTDLRWIAGGHLRLSTVCRGAFRRRARDRGATGRTASVRHSPV
jgi:hypothetical protein